MNATVIRRPICLLPLKTRTTIRYLPVLTDLRSGTLTSLLPLRSLALASATRLRGLTARRISITKRRGLLAETRTGT